MHVLAQHVPALILVASASGALVLCLLIYLYGFSPSADDGPRQAIRRLLVTRIGLAIAAVCFAVTAVLATVLGPWQRSPSPAAFVPAPPPPPPPRVQAPAPPPGADVAKLRGAVESLEARLRQLEVSFRDVGATTRTTTARLERLERTKTQVAQPTVKPAPQPTPSALARPRERARLPAWGEGASLRGEPGRASGEGPVKPGDRAATWSDPLAPPPEPRFPQTGEWLVPEPPAVAPMRFAPEPQERSASRPVPPAPRSRASANHPLPPLERLRLRTSELADGIRDGFKRLGSDIADGAGALADRVRERFARD